MIEAVYGLIGLSFVVAFVCLVRAFGPAWLAWCHGVGSAEQYQFFRCHACRRIVTHRHISVGGCPCRESSKVSPAALRWSEKARLLFLPWSITSPSVHRESTRRARMSAERERLRGLTTPESLADWRTR